MTTHKPLFLILPAILLATFVGSAAAQETPKMKKFLTKPLVIEDQGSFFIGGVPKVTNYATVPAAGQSPIPNQITIGQMYVQFEIPATKKRNAPPVIMVHGSTHTAAVSNRRRMAAKAGIPISCARASRPTWSTRLAEGAPDSTNRYCMKPQP